nr:hypothetical protein [Streptomyces sp. SID8014]
MGGGAGDGAQTVVGDGVHHQQGPGSPGGVGDGPEGRHGSSSWDLLRGVPTPSDAEVEVKRAALECSRSAVLVAGSSKFGKYRVASLSDFDAIIPGPALTEAAAEGVRGSGTEPHLAAPA